jgi:hypothetical protein
VPDVTGRAWSPERRARSLALVVPLGFIAEKDGVASFVAIAPRTGERREAGRVGAALGAASLTRPRTAAFAGETLASADSTCERAV